MHIKDYKILYVKKKLYKTVKRIMQCHAEQHIKVE